MTNKGGRPKRADYVYANGKKVLIEDADDDFEDSPPFDDLAEVSEEEIEEIVEGRNGRSG